MKLIIAAILLSIGIFADAQQIVKLTGKKEILKVENLKAHPDGSISYKFSGKEWKAPEFSYDYARIPKPKAILAADQVLKKGNFKKALKLYQIEYDKYKNLGWGVYCITGMAKALDRDGNLKEALKQLERLKYYESPDPHLEKDFSDAKMLYTDLLIKAKDYKSALSVTESMLASKENSVVFFTDRCHRTYGKQVNNQIHHGNLNKNRDQFFCNNPNSADRMCKQKFCSPVFFFFAEHTHCTKSCKKCSSKPQHITALNAIISNQCAKIQLIHTKGCSECPHRRKQLIDSFHFSLHFRKKKYADRQQKTCRSCPDQKSKFSLSKFMFYNSHTLSPAFS